MVDRAERHSVLCPNCDIRMAYFQFVTAHDGQIIKMLGDGGPLFPKQMVAQQLIEQLKLNPSHTDSYYHAAVVRLSSDGFFTLHPTVLL